MSIYEKLLYLVALANQVPDIWEARFVIEPNNGGKVVRIHFTEQRSWENSPGDVERWTDEYEVSTTSSEREIDDLIDKVNEAVEKEQEELRAHQLRREALLRISPADRELLGLKL